MREELESVEKDNRECAEEKQAKSPCPSPGERKAQALPKRPGRQSWRRETAVFPSGQASVIPLVDRLAMEKNPSVTD